MLLGGGLSGSTGGGFRLTAVALLAWTCEAKFFSWYTSICECSYGAINGRLTFSFCVAAGDGSTDSGGGSDGAQALLSLVAPVLPVKGKAMPVCFWAPAFDAAVDQDVADPELPPRFAL